MNKYLTNLSKEKEGVAKQLRLFYTDRTPLIALNPYGRDYFTIRQTQKAEHMYPNTLLVKATANCFSDCAYCFRKHEMGSELEEITEEDLRKIFDEYVTGYNSQQTKERDKIKEVLVTGGDPLILNQSLLEKILRKVKKSDIEFIRIGSRATSFAPRLVTDDLVAMLNNYKPLIVIGHYNHIDELTTKSLKASEKLLNIGIRIKNQSVFLRGINDNPDELHNLFWELNKNGIQPYRLYHCVPTGYEDLRPTVKEGINITRELQNTSGTIGHFDFSIFTPLGKIVDPKEEDILDEKKGSELIKVNEENINRGEIDPNASYLKLRITSRTTKEDKIPKEVWYRDGTPK